MASEKLISTSYFAICLVLCLGSCASDLPGEKTKISNSLHPFTDICKREIWNEVTALEVSLNHCQSTIDQRGPKVAVRHATFGNMIKAYEDLENSVKPHIQELSGHIRYVDELTRYNSCEDEYHYFVVTAKANEVITKLTAWQ